MVLLFRDDSHIQKFFVEWDNSAHKKAVIGHVNRWMLVAVRRNVQEITVRIGQNNHIMYKIPHQLFNCKSLRKLSMIKCGGGKSAGITLPKSMCFPQLQVLCLVGFSVSNVELMEKFLSSCPVLKTFHISEFDIGTQHNLIVESTCLENLVLDTSCCIHLGQTDHGVTSVTKLCAPKLKDFVCTGLMTQEYSFGNFYSLVSAAILMKLKKKSKDEILDTYSKLPVEEKEVYAKSMMKFLVAVHKVASMRLSFGFLEVLSRAPNLLDCPHFCNLQYLQLEMWFTRDSLRSIAYLLRNSPIIYSVVLTSMESNSEDIGTDWEAGLSLPGMLSRLKIVEIKAVKVTRIPDAVKRKEDKTRLP
ncbi:F-box/FBD/LRR-repeat protein At5g22660-like isoform X2 [Papaver somniferum]|uniref:F-box/FBD/LRR-repeat protein At5g22660-like isoform X2 n=1 Tax=Papaver somniferum TaxID=3469 RepID=UPI000E6F7667|nr:F-box/FBD/LRR-repeat protein At5g22660-like isoform X2 [Papaver somniferum]